MWTLQTPTILQETDGNFLFCVAHGGQAGPFPDIDFFVRDNGANGTEFHSMSGNGGYQKYLLQVVLPLPGASGPQYDLLWIGGSYIYRVDKLTGVVEVCDTNSVVRRVSIPFQPGVLRQDFRFTLTKKGLIAIDPRGSSGMTEAYVIDFDQQGGFTVPVRYVTLWGPSDDSIDFVGIGGGIGIAMYNRGANASLFTEWSCVDGTFQRYVGAPNRPTELDAPVNTDFQVMFEPSRRQMCVVIRRGTATKTTEVHIAPNP